MSTTTYEISTVRDIQFALKGVAPGTQVDWANAVGDLWPTDQLVIETTCAGKPENAHFVRIGPGGLKDE